MSSRISARMPPAANEVENPMPNFPSLTTCRCATRGEECVQIRHDPARLIQKPGPGDGRHGSASRSVEEANPDPTFKGREFSAQSRLFHAKDIGGTGDAAEI